MADVAKEPITVTIEGDTTDLNAKLDESLAKAKELDALLQDMSITPLQSETKDYKAKILAEIICKTATEEKLTIRDILSALRIVIKKYVADATI